MSDDAPTRFWDARERRWTVQVLPGQIYVTDRDELISTVLGSCVSACVRDPRAGVGGINHFMLPNAPRGADHGASARYGLYALECLLNEVLKRGGRRSELEVKVFGGGRVIESGGDIGRSNVEFVHRFFADEGIPIAVHDTGESVARRIRYWVKTGRVQVKHMPMARAASVVEREARAAAVPAPSGGTVELF